MTLPKRIQSIVGRLDDGLNPILVKNLKQAIHGKFLHRTFGLSLIGATLAGLLALLAIDSDAGSDSGQDFLSFIYFAFCFGVVGVLPISALINGDSDKARTEKLFLSPLTAAAIVRGRLWAALGQGGILAMALVPFMSLSLILPGVDLVVLLIVIITTLLLGISLSAVGVGLSSFVTHRMLQAFVTAFMAMGQLGAFGVAFLSGVELIEHPSQVQRNFFPSLLAIIWMHFLTLIVFSLCLGQKGVSRPEEDSARSGRRAMVALLMLALACQWILPAFGSSISGSDAAEFSQYITLVFATGLAPFVVEPERMASQLQSKVSSRRLRALLQIPWISGGGRGMLLFFGMMFIWAMLWVVLPPPLDPGHTMSVRNYDMLWESGARTVVYLGLTAPLIRLIPHPYSGLLAVPVMWCFWGMVGMGLGFLDVVFKSAHLDLVEFFGEEEGLDLLLVAALLINLPRILVGVMEVISVSESQEGIEMSKNHA
jgi:hypothetical protein